MLFCKSRPPCPWTIPCVGHIFQPETLSTSSAGSPCCSYPLYMHLRLILLHPPRRCLKATMRLPLIWREICHGSESSSQYLHGLTVRAGHTRWSLGSALFLASWAAIMGPWTYCQHLISTPRLPFTAAYFGSIGLTLYFSLGVSVLPARERRPGSSR